MKKFWSFFWLVVAAIVAAAILLSWIAPYMWVLITLALVASVGFITYKAYGMVTSRRRHF